MKELIYSCSKFDKFPNSVGIVPEKGEPLIPLFEQKPLIRNFRNEEKCFYNPVRLVKPPN